MVDIHPNYDCPSCGEPALVDTSTNFNLQWSCNWCGKTHDPDDVKDL
jgi:ribosomal protein L37AE/L43A